MEKYTESIGMIHGEIKEIIPAKNAIIYTDIFFYSFIPKNSFSFFSLFFILQPP